MTQPSTPGVAAFAVEDPRAPDVRVLIEELDAEMAALSDLSLCDLSTAEDLSADYVQFLVARFHGHPIACGALVVKDIDWGEIKRMYVRPVVRGKGLSKALLDHLLDMARRRELRRVRLETSVQQEAALALYRAAGFEPCAPYAEHHSTDAAAAGAVYLEVAL
ncbi:MAG: GNAT family N-acetyltransferase [Alphaproteobacteria bacterium]